MKKDLSKRPAAGLKIERVTVRTGIVAGGAGTRLCGRDTGRGCSVGC